MGEVEFEAMAGVEGERVSDLTAVDGRLGGKCTVRKRPRRDQRGKAGMSGRTDI